MEKCHASTSTLTKVYRWFLDCRWAGWRGQQGDRSGVLLNRTSMKVRVLAQVGGNGVPHDCCLVSANTFKDAPHDLLTVASSERWRIVKEHHKIWKFGDFSYSDTKCGYAWGTWCWAHTWTFHVWEIHWMFLSTTWLTCQTPGISGGLLDSIFILISRPRKLCMSSHCRAQAEE